MSEIPLNTIINPIGNIITLFKERQLGKGSYGTVLEGCDQGGKSFAVKIVPIEKSGIPNILETSIMASINHMNLAHATKIYSDGKKLYIFSELALTDLARYTRELLPSKNLKVEISQLRKWCFGLVQALSHLHKQNIIHADIKASNVLLFSDEHVKLTDFTLSLRKWDDEECLVHSVCTITHRPPEVFTGEGWSYPLDIWSLGCTFFEMAYGTLLFPYQGGKGISGEITKSRTLKCLDKWSRDYFSECNLFKNIPDNLKKNLSIGNDFIPPFIPEEWTNVSNNNGINNGNVNINSNNNNGGNNINNNSNNNGNIDIHRSDKDKESLRLFRDMLVPMLHPDQTKRPTIFQILKHPFFTGMIVLPCMILTSQPEEISLKTMQKLTKFLKKFSHHPNVIKLSIQLYRRCLQLREISDELKIAAIAYIAGKIVLGKELDVKIPVFELFPSERLVCQYLKYQLHGIKKD